MMKKLKQPTPTRRIEQLDHEALRKVTGGGLQGPDPCDGRYKITCIQDVTPPSTQDC